MKFIYVLFVLCFFFLKASAQDGMFIAFQTKLNSFVGVEKVRPGVAVPASLDEDDVIDLTENYEVKLRLIDEVSVGFVYATITTPAHFKNFPIFSHNQPPNFLARPHFCYEVKEFARKI